MLIGLIDASKSLVNRAGNNSRSKGLAFLEVGVVLLPGNLFRASFVGLTSVPIQYFCA